MIVAAILGYGTVGSGVAEVLETNRESIAANVGEAIEVKYIVDVRDFPEDARRGLIVKDFSVVEADPEVRVVVETIGGLGVAQEFTRRALEAGKSVVTSNKELVAKKGTELLAIAREKGVNYLFEASVGGGIPIIRPLTQCLAANRIDEIYGILNGTTNYILTEMFRKGVPMESALQRAQELGYAERDPSADILGVDACRKICILSDLCFGCWVDPDRVRARGIRDIAPEDVALAEQWGCSIKLLGRALRREGGIYAYVEPHLVSRDHLLSEVSGVMNAVAVRGNAIGEAIFYGAGAGKLPTASAVCADVMDVAKADGTRREMGWSPAREGWLGDIRRLPSRWFVRCGQVPAWAEESVSGAAGSAFVTPAMSEEELEARLGDLAVSACYRILD